MTDLRHPFRRLVMLTMAVAVLVGMSPIAGSSAELTPWETIAVGKVWGGGPEFSPGAARQNGYPLVPTAVLEMTTRTNEDPRRLRLIIDTPHQEGPVTVDGYVAMVCRRKNDYVIFTDFIGQGDQLPYKSKIYSRKTSGYCDRMIVTVSLYSEDYQWAYELRAKLQVKYHDAG